VDSSAQRGPNLVRTAACAAQYHRDMSLHFTPVFSAAAVLALVLGASAGSTAHSASAAVDPPSDAAALAPQIVDTRFYRVMQTVELHDVPSTAKQVKLWVPIAGDGPWQRILERRVVDAPKDWRLVRQPGSRGDVVFVEFPGGDAGTASVKVTVESLVRRESPAVDLTATPTSSAPIQAELFAEMLRTDAPNMVVDDKIRTLARTACAGETDPRRKVLKLLGTAADVADHYSKDPTKPHCGRGSAEDCMANGGGCCTDLHSLFIALARAEGIPARLQMGYRLKPENEGKAADPSYRCWAEYWLDGSGWVPTDIVVADSGDSESRSMHWGRVDARRLWLWEGRGFDLSPKQSAPAIQTMFCGWAEIDGEPVDPLPFTDGKPSKLRRTVAFDDVTEEFTQSK
jgi:hypothetical protein